MVLRVFSWSHCFYLGVQEDTISGWPSYQDRSITCLLQNSHHHEQFLNHYRLRERIIYISSENWRSLQPWEFYSSMHLIPPLENCRGFATHQFAHHNHPFTTRTRSTCAPHQLETSFTLVHHLIIRRAFIGSGLFLDGRTPYTWNYFLTNRTLAASHRNWLHDQHHVW